MKNISLLLVLVCLGCSRSGSSAPASAISPVKTEAPKIDCSAQIEIMKSANVDQLKEGLDQIVRQIPDKIKQNLILGTKVYRRATPSKLYSDQQIQDASNNALASLNEIGKLIQSLSYSVQPANIELSSGMFYDKVVVYPQPAPEKSGADVTLGDQFDKVPTYGITAGENAGQVGFDLFGQVFMKSNEIFYTISLIYSPAIKDYIVTTFASNTNDYQSVNFDVRACAADAQIKAWTKMPIVQENVNECESGICQDESIVQ